MTQNPPAYIPDLVANAVSGNRRALAKLLSMVEAGKVDGESVLAQLFPHTGTAHIVGITGSSGSGKSTLVNGMARELRRLDIKVAVVAVDPTSPFSGGAILGDRLRMRDLTTDPGVFIRSMASRGHPGGIAHATRGIVSVLDAVGFPIILVETVGAGQAQIEVAQVAQTVVLVEAPGMGDDIQALKAGMMEIADIIVVNKADRPDAQKTLQAIKSIHTLRGQPDSYKVSSGSSEATPSSNVWTVPVMKTSAMDGEGLADLMTVIAEHRIYLDESGQWLALRERHIRAEIESWFQRYIQNWVKNALDKEELDAAVESILQSKQTPVTAAQHLYQSVFGKDN